MYVLINFQLQVVKVDLFGVSSDEKEVTKIAGKTVEARGNKSYNTLHIAAEFITEKSLLNIIIPFKDVSTFFYSVELVFLLVSHSNVCFDHKATFFLS